MAKKQNSINVSNGGYTLSPTYSTTFPGSNYSNITITGGGTTYATGATNATCVPESYYLKKPKINITDTDLVLNGLSLRDFMHSVQKELLIPGRLNQNADLEQEFAELKAAADHYHELEEKFLEQKAMWEALKKTD